MVGNLDKTRTLSTVLLCVVTDTAISWADRAGRPPEDNDALPGVWEP